MFLAEVNPTRALLLALCWDVLASRNTANSFSWESLASFAGRFLAPLLLFRQLRPDTDLLTCSAILVLAALCWLLPRTAAAQDLAKRGFVVILLGPSLLAFIVGLAGDGRWEAINEYGPFTAAGVSAPEQLLFTQIGGDLSELPAWRPPLPARPSLLGGSSLHNRALLLSFMALISLMLRDSKLRSSLTKFAPAILGYFLIAPSSDWVVFFHDSERAWRIDVNLDDGATVELLDAPQVLTSKTFGAPSLILNGGVPADFEGADSPDWVEAELRWWASGETGIAPKSSWLLVNEQTLYRLPQQVLDGNR